MHLFILWDVATIIQQQWVEYNWITVHASIEELYVVARWHSKFSKSQSTLRYFGRKLGQDSNNVSFLIKGFSSAMMEIYESLKRGWCNQIFLTPSVPLILDNVNTSQYFPCHCGQTQSVQSGTSALILTGNFQVTCKMIFIRCHYCTLCIHLTWTMFNHSAFMLFLRQTNKLSSVQL